MKFPLPLIPAQEPKYAGQPTGPICYCGRPNNLLDCYYPSCAASPKWLVPRTQDSSLSTPKEDWAKVYAEMDK